MAYELSFSLQAIKALQKMQPKRRLQIRSKLIALAEDPFAPNNNVKALKGREGYRLRIGDYRVIYELHDNTLILLVLEVGNRGDIY